ncbi:phage terminase large subunit family protein [Methylomonas sp. HYX-M1]|uniref:phage terminase large subunit family protein n=1 Tax=Methylomonas sp. HYX-M1 TaxID=3139307 RepID=UPI00345C2E43
MSAAVDIRKNIAKMIRPPERISVVEASKRYVNVRTASGGIAPWDASLTPYMIEPMNCLSSRQYDAVIFVGPAQSGKTQGLITNFMAYIIKCDPSDALIMQTTKGTARDFDTQVIKRAFRDSPSLKEELAPGSKSDNTYDKVFKSGAILFQRWPSINEISGKPLKYVLITDYDRMTQNVDGEGSPFALSQQRTAKFLSRGMTLVETSPGFEITDPKPNTHYKHEAPPCGGALSLYNMGDMRRWYVQCPECGEYYLPPPDQRGLHFIHERDLFGVTVTQVQQQVKYQCTRNGCLIDVNKKREMNRTGIWVPEGATIVEGRLAGEPVKSRVASFWFPGVFAAYSDPANLVDKYLKAHREYDITGSEENLKTIVNVNFGAAYLPRHLAELESGDDLANRAEALERYHVPASARLLVAAVDIQNGRDARFVVQVHAVGVGMEQTLIDRFDIAFTEKDGTKRRVEPGVYKEDWDLLTEKVINASYKTGDGRKMLIHLIAIDTGGNGNTTDYAYQFYRRMKKSGLSGKVMLVKGGSKDDKSPIVKSFGKDNQGRPMKDIPLYILNTNAFKDKVDAMLRRVHPGGLYLHFPHWLDVSFYDELRAEVRGENGKWEKIRARNEGLDLCVYILACCWRLRLNDEKFDWEKPPIWAAALESNSNIVSAAEARQIRTPSAPEKPPMATVNPFTSDSWSSRL